MQISQKCSNKCSNIRLRRQREDSDDSTRVEKLDFSRNETRRKLSFSFKPLFASLALARYIELLKVICAPITNANKRALIHAFRYTYTAETCAFQFCVLSSSLVHWTLFNVMALHIVNAFANSTCVILNISTCALAGSGDEIVNALANSSFLAHLKQCVQWALSPVF